MSILQWRPRWKQQEEEAVRTVGVGGWEHGALGDGAEEPERGRAGAVPVGAVAALRLPGVHRPQPHRHHDPLLPARHRRRRLRRSRLLLPCSFTNYLLP
jgi:hypothetical protein